MRTPGPAGAFKKSVQTEMALDPGTKLGPYEILSPIGSGGMGEVYKARDTPVAAERLKQRRNSNS